MFDRKEDQIIFNKIMRQINQNTQKNFQNNNTKNVVSSNRTSTQSES